MPRIALENEHSGSHGRTRVAGTDHSVGFAVLDQIEGDPDGGILLFPNSVRGGIAHTHHLAGMTDADIQPLDPMLLQLVPDLARLANQDNGDSPFSGSGYRPFDFHRWGMVGAHGIDRNNNAFLQAEVLTLLY